jgi:hypothetical protein
MITSKVGSARSLVQAAILADGRYYLGITVSFHHEVWGSINESNKNYSPTFVDYRDFGQVDTNNMADLERRSIMSKALGSNCKGTRQAVDITVPSQ